MTARRAKRTQTAIADCPPIAKTRRGSPERTVQVAIVTFLRVALPGGSIVAAIKNEAKAASTTKYGPARFQLMRRREGVVAGFPDLVLLIPGPTGPKFAFVEVKAPRGAPSDTQLELHDELRALGFPVIVARSIEDVAAGLRAAGIALRTNSF